MMSFLGRSFPKATLHLKSYQTTSENIVLKEFLVHFLEYSMTQHHPNTSSLKKDQITHFLTVTSLTTFLMTVLIHKSYLGHHHKPKIYPCAPCLVYDMENFAYSTCSIIFKGYEHDKYCIRTTLTHVS